MPGTIRILIDGHDCAMYYYLRNNQNDIIGIIDSSGKFWETVFDIVSLGFSICDAYKNPSDPWAWAGLADQMVKQSNFLVVLVRVNYWI